MKSVQIRPYARLLTMLGDQLIKNERIALIELIKNSYDADASWVKISFVNFDKNLKITGKSKIIIEDDGHGMSYEILEKHWPNPATPEKKKRKDKVSKSPGGRIMQGEKGIGRFASLKLGSVIKVISRAESDNVEHELIMDLSQYDDEFLTKDGKEKELFIDDLTVEIETRTPKMILEKEIQLSSRKILRKPKGTRIEISSLKGSWTEDKIRKVYHDIARFQPFIRENEDPEQKITDSESDFEVFIYEDGKLREYREEFVQRLSDLLQEKAVFRINDGVFDEKNGQYRFKLNGNEKVLKLLDPTIRGLKPFRDYFGKKGEVLEDRKTECGDFSFKFFIFDFSPQVSEKNELDNYDKEIIKNHRIYLYRDGIRVYPYGEPDNDWLQIDVYRGTISAAHFLSNDQVVGVVNISQEKNPRLRDKTNREGLIEEGNAAEDLFALLRIFLAYVRQYDYSRYRSDLNEKKGLDVFRNEQIKNKIQELIKKYEKNAQVKNDLTDLEKDYRAERNYLVRRAEMTEELAAVGLSVETTSHDIMSIMGKAKNALDRMTTDFMHTGEIDREKQLEDLQTMRGMLSFVHDRLKDIQQLFKSSKQRRRNIKVKEYLGKIIIIYKHELKKNNINYEIIKSGSPLVAKLTDAVLLQLLINLFDNSIFWLQTISREDKKIEIYLDGDEGTMVFSDNGPGVDDEDKPYIFEPFYSGKGEDGRGLGLYIARQLLERNDYKIELAELKSEKKLPGANFIVSFISVEE